MKDILKKLNELRKREVEILFKMAGRLFLCSIFVGIIEQVIGTVFFGPILFLASFFTIGLVALLDIGD